MKKCFDSSAIALDVPRSWKQYIARKIARLSVNITRLNRPGFFATEIIQAIQPVVSIPTRHGTLLSICNHGRLLWRARTFHTEEPQTVEWLDTITKDDVFWDVGANIGLYSIYAAKFKRCQVVAFEPESQNYSLLVRNIVLNRVEQFCMPSNIAITNISNIGQLQVRYLTQGGAYNMFEIPELTTELGIRSPHLYLDEMHPIRQLIYGASLDELITKYNLVSPTYLKIDVDGLESWIVDGASGLLNTKTLRNVLIEINRNSERDQQIPRKLYQHGFRLASERSNWLSREDRSREDEMPTVNMIFERDK